MTAENVGTVNGVRPINPDTAEETPSRLRSLLSTGFGYIAICVAIMWVIEIVDTTLLDNTLQRHGIHPRETDGLDGIIWHPWLHSTYGHVASNSVPLLALGWLVTLRGLRHWLIVTIAVVLGGGALTWLLADGSNHIGASGIVFGYFGALIGAAIRHRRPTLLAPALVAIFIYGTMLAGVVPQPEISWQGHLFGLVVGVVAAWLLTEPPAPKIDDGLPMYPWELDEPWLATEEEL